MHFEKRDWKFFFHEYGRRVGMVPRSSLEEGKYSQMVEKRTVEKRDWYTVIVNESEVLCRTQEPCCLQDKDSCPVV